MQAEDANQLYSVGCTTELAGDGEIHSKNLGVFGLAEVRLILWAAV